MPIATYHVLRTVLIILDYQYVRLLVSYSRLARYNHKYYGIDTNAMTPRDAFTISQICQ